MNRPKNANVVCNDIRYKVYWTASEHGSFEQFSEKYSCEFEVHINFAVFCRRTLFNVT